MLSSERTSDKSGIFFMNSSISYQKQFEVDYTKQQGPKVRRCMKAADPRSELGSTSLEGRNHNYCDIQENLP